MAGERRVPLTLEEKLKLLEIATSRERSKDTRLKLLDVHVSAEIQERVGALALSIAKACKILGLTVEEAQPVIEEIPSEIKKLLERDFRTLADFANEIGLEEVMGEEES